MAQNPPLMWAQDKTRIFVTIKLQDVTDEQIDFTPNSFAFRGVIRSPPVAYDHTLELFQEIVPDDAETKYVKYGRYLQLNLRKKDDGIWWSRLAKSQQKLHNVRIDWEKWVDDDEADAKVSPKAKVQPPADLSSSDSDDASEPPKEDEESEVKKEEDPAPAQEEESAPE
jgi:hypothetical protein